MFKKAFVVSLVFILVPLFQTNIVIADENLDIKKEPINPGSIYYPLKRLWEKGWEKLQFNGQSKINFHNSLLKARLSELQHVVDNKILSEIQTSSERFSYQAGILAEVLDDANGDKNKLIKEFEQMSKNLADFRDQYPANSSFWMLIQHDINTLNILSDQLK